MGLKCSKKQKEGDQKTSKKSSHPHKKKWPKSKVGMKRDTKFKKAHPLAQGAPAPKEENHEIWEAIPDDMLLPEERLRIGKRYPEAHSLALANPAPEDHKKEVWEAVPLHILPEQKVQAPVPFKDAHKLARGKPAPENAKKEIWEAIPPHLLQPEEPKAQLEKNGWEPIPARILNPEPTAPAVPIGKEIVVGDERLAPIPPELQKVIDEEDRKMPSIPLQVMRQDTVDFDDIVGLSKPEDVPLELQKQEILMDPNLGKCFHCNGSGNIKLDEIASMASEAVPGELGSEECWVCRGTGRLGKFISSFEAPEGDEDDKHLCQICFGSSDYGLSKTCEHFYCIDCIKGALEAMLNSGQFPAYCPACRADAMGQPERGLIEGSVLSFLQQRCVVTMEFLFRFMKQITQADRKASTEYFKCPANCGDYLVDEESVWITHKDELQRKPGRCRCGALVCLHCHLPVAEDEMHKCPPKLRLRDANDPASLALMAKLGKKCPKCGNFLQKDGGCEYMFCGTKAHGRLLDALNNGGCGHQFHWKTLKPVKTFYIDLDDKRVDGYTGDMRYLLKKKR